MAYLHNSTIKNAVRQNIIFRLTALFIFLLLVPMHFPTNPLYLTLVPECQITSTANFIPAYESEYNSAGQWKSVFLPSKSISFHNSLQKS